MLRSLVSTSGLARAVGRGHNLSKHGTRGRSDMAVELDRSIVWMDIEMTGLDIFKDHILEIACLVTDDKLTVKSPDFHVIINQPDEVLDNMNDWCKQHHKLSGLTDACKRSTLTLDSAEKQLLEFLQRYIPEKHCPLAGNSIYMDRLFLRRYMPAVDGYLHYRIIDVSTIAELARRWNPAMGALAPKKQRSHQATNDIHESIDQLKYYQKNFFQIPN